MENQKSGSIRLCDMAEQLSHIYDEFTEKVKALGTKGKSNKKSSKFAGSLTHWIGGSHATTERELLCENFLTNVQSHLELIQTAIESSEESEITVACDILAEILTRPCSQKSNATTDLMKRAMIGQVKPFLKYVSRTKLLELKQRMEGAYTKWQMLPVEKDVYKEMSLCLSQREQS